MPTRIASTFHSASSVVSSVKCSLGSGELEHLVTAKLNSLQVYSILESRLQLECSLEIRGKVRLIRVIPIKASSRSNILVLLDHPDPEVLILNYTQSVQPGSGKLNVKHQISLEERGSRPAEFCTDALVHPSGSFAVISCYNLKLKVITIDDGQLYNLPLPEPNLLSFTFLPLLNDDNHAVALLYLDHNERVNLVARDLRISSDAGADLDDELSSLLQPTSISLKDLPTPFEDAPQLVAVPADDENAMIDDDAYFNGGILVLGGRKIMLYELASQEARETLKGKRKRSGRKSLDGNSGKQKKEIKKREPTALVRWPWSRISAWTAIDDPLQKILVGDMFGRLAMLSLANMKELGMILLPLGETSPATSISYLTNQVAFIGSHLGNPQVIRISEVPVSSLETPTLPISNRIKTVSPSSLNRIDEKGKGPSFDDEDDIGKGRIIATMGSYIDVIQTFTNIAPIRDAVLTDLDGSEQAHIVTCSGGGNTGSVNVVRIGADFEELAAISGLENIANLWPIKHTYNSLEHAHFVTTTLIETHVFHLTSANEIQFADGLHDFLLEEQTLHVGNMVVRRNDRYDGDSSLVVQVFPSGARLLQYNQVFQKWELVHTVFANTVNNKGRFVAASGNASQVLIAQVEGWLLSYTIQNEGGLKLILRTNRKLDYSTGLLRQESELEFTTLPDAPRDWYNSEISAIHCPILDPTKHFSAFVAAAFWHTNQLKIYTYDSSGGFEFACQTPSLASPVRSILLNYMTKDRYRLRDRDSHLCVFATLADGSVVTFEMVLNEENNTPELKDMNVTSLGQSPVALNAYEVGSKRVVIAGGSRAAVFSWERSHLRAAPVMLKDITSVRALNSENYPEALLIGTESGILIGKVTNLDKMHIRSTSMGLDNPRHIVHEPVFKVFGVACVRTEPGRVGEEEQVKSSFKLLDDTNLSELTQIALEQDEHVMSLTIINVTVNDRPRPIFCVGTMMLLSEELEPANGRILLYEPYQVSPSKMQLNCVAYENVNGCVYSLAVVNGILAAAINSSVFLFRLSHGPEDPDSLEQKYFINKTADWNHNYMVTAISAYDDHLVVADQFSSVSLLKMNARQKLMTAARDYSPLWPVAVEAFDKENIIGADQSLNLFTFCLGHTGNRAILKRDGFYHLGDLVVKFARGSISSTDVATSRGLKSTHIFCTLSGQVGVIIDVQNEAQSRALTSALTLLETGLPLKSDILGGVSHARYRAPRTSRNRSDADEPAHGILDGDLLEQLLAHIDTTPELVEELFASNEILYPLPELKKDLEALQTMH